MERRRLHEVFGERRKVGCRRRAHKIWIGDNIYIAYYSNFYTSITRHTQNHLQFMTASQHHKSTQNQQLINPFQSCLWWKIQGCRLLFQKYFVFSVQASNFGKQSRLILVESVSLFFELVAKYIPLAGPPFCTTCSTFPPLGHASRSCSNSRYGPDLWAGTDGSGSSIEALLQFVGLHHRKFLHFDPGPSTSNWFSMSGFCRRSLPVVGWWRSPGSFVDLCYYTFSHPR